MRFLGIVLHPMTYPLRHPFTPDSLHCPSLVLACHQELERGVGGALLLGVWADGRRSAW